MIKKINLNEMRERNRMKSLKKERKKTETETRKTKNNIWQLWWCLYKKKGNKVVMNLKKNYCLVTEKL